MVTGGTGNLSPNLPVESPLSVASTASVVERPPFWVIVAITTSGIMTNTMITAGLPDILDGVGADRALAGLLVAAGSLPGIVLATVIGLLADKWGRREILVPAMLVFAIVGAMGALAQNLPQLLAVRLVQGSASAGLINLGAVLIADHWPGKERARLLGINAGILTICLALFPVIGGGLVDLFGWRAPFLAYLVALGPALIAWRRLPKGTRSDVSIANQVRATFPYLRRPETIAVLASTALLFVLIFGMLLTVLPLHADEVFGLGPTYRGVVLGLPAIGSTTAAFTVQRIRGRIGVRNIAITIGVLFSGALVLMGGAKTLPLLALGAILFGLGEGLSFPTFQDRLAGSVPEEVRGTMMATQVSAARTGQVIGPVLVGGLKPAVGTANTFFVGAGIAAALLAPVALRAVRSGDGPVGSDPIPQANEG